MTNVALLIKASKNRLENFIVERREILILLSELVCNEQTLENKIHKNSMIAEVVLKTA